MTRQGGLFRSRNKALVVREMPWTLLLLNVRL